jgi:hypothetical protein
MLRARAEASFLMSANHHQKEAVKPTVQAEEPSVFEVTEAEGLQAKLGQHPRIVGHHPIYPGCARYPMRDHSKRGCRFGLVA